MSKLVENYLLQEPIGKGVYGQVYRAIHQISKGEFAVKVIPKVSFRSNPKLQQLAINEINILSSLKNQSIVRFIETLKTPNNFYFVYEYCNGGTLETMLKKKKFLTQSQALIIFKQLVEAFKELNKNSIMHRDLKPDNIFFNDGKLKLGDFGFCKMLEINMAQTMLGSPIYMAPEVLREEIYTSKADIWSLGVVMFEMLFGYCPFESSSICELINKIKETQLNIPKEINPISLECQSLIKKMLVKEQFKRIQWVDLFDIKVNQNGKIESAQRKSLGIDVLEKYFLMDLKVDDQSKKPFEFRSQKNIPFDLPKMEKEKQNMKTYQLPNQQPKQKQKSQQNENIDQPYIPLKKMYSSPTQKPQQQKKQILIHIPTLKANDLLQSQQYSPLLPPKTATPIQQKNSFSKKHLRWQQGLQYLSSLLELPQASSPNRILFFICSILLKQISEEYSQHPQWTDILMEQKRIILEFCGALGFKNWSEGDMRGAKGQILKMWRNLSDHNELSVWDKVIRFIYGFEDSHRIEIESILLG